MKITSLLLALVLTVGLLQAQCSEIYFYRPASLGGGEDNMTLSIVGGGALAKIPYGSVIKATACTSGKYWFKASIDRLGGGAKLALDVMNGETYYVRTTSSMGITMASIKLVTREKGLKDLGRISRYPRGQGEIQLPQPSVVSGGSNVNTSTKGGATAPAPTTLQGLPNPQNVGGFRFAPTAVTKAGNLLQIDYEITNLTNQDRWFHASGSNVNFYDEFGNLLKGQTICIMGDCRSWSGLNGVPTPNTRGEFLQAGVQVKVLVPHGIPVKGSITLGGLRANTTRLTRGQIIFRSISPNNYKDRIDPVLNYGPIIVPETRDENNPMRHNIGAHSMEVKEARHINGRVEVTGIWKNSSTQDYQLTISGSNFINNVGNQVGLTEVAFGDEGQQQIYRNRSVHTVPSGATLPFVLYTAPAAAPVTNLRRLTIGFGSYELTWDNVAVEQGSGGSSPRLGTETNPVNNNYLSYRQFEDRVSTNTNVKGKKVILENINFNLGSDDILPASFAQLDRLAAVMQRNSSMVIQIIGHTDNTGNAGQNLLLSQKRADAIRYYLMGKSVAPDRMTSIGKGAAEGLTSNDTETGRQQNRRVEIRVPE